MAGIYLHIPFCKQACYYCDFHFSTSLQYIDDVIEAMLKEIKIRKNYADGESLETIYFGGGTPSLVGPRRLARLLDEIRRVHRIGANAEITVEANPDDLSPTTAHALYDLGVNRLSIGIQSFHNDRLRMLHRVHTAQDAQMAFRHARGAGFDNINLDLIFGIPASTTDEVLQDVDALLELAPEHISAYTLTVEPNTVFGHWTRAGRMDRADDRTTADQFVTVMQQLRSGGYEHYEISNYARPGCRSRHNTAYWQHKRYIGIGPGAHSFNGSSREYNVANNHLYRKSLAAGEVRAQRENLSSKQLANEYLMLSLRTAEGCDTERLGQAYGTPLGRAQKARVEDLVRSGHLNRQGHRLMCTDRGKLLADEITVMLWFD